MVTVEELRARMEQRWAAGEHASWPPPRDPMDSPREEEYSRVTDPGRYRIVHERARLWAEVLGELPEVEVEDADGRGLRLTCDRAGTLPLLLLERMVAQPGDDALAVLRVAVARPEIELTEQPDCGCDACDTGSDDILGTIDEHVLVAVGGPLVLLRAPHWYATWHPGGGASGGDGRGPDHRQVLDLCRRLAAGERPPLPPDVHDYVGRSWLA